MYIKTNFLPPSFFLFSLFMCMCEKLFFSSSSILYSFKLEASPHNNVHYERIVIKKKTTLNLTHSTCGWFLCWRNGFQKEYYILYNTAWSSCGIRLYCIYTLLSAELERGHFGGGLHWRRPPVEAASNFFCGGGLREALEAWFFWRLKLLFFYKNHIKMVEMTEN